MAVIQPLPTPQFGRLVGQGVQTFSNVQEIQRRQTEADRRARIEDLAKGAEVDPQRLAELAAADPQRAIGIQQSQEVALTRERRAKELFEKERAFTAEAIEGRPRDEQLLVLDQRLDTLKRRGEPSFRTQKLRDLVAGTSGENAQAQVFIRNAILQGRNQNFLFRPTVPKAQRLSNIQEIQLKADERFPTGTPENAAEFDRLFKIKSPGTSISFAGTDELDKLDAQRVDKARTQADISRGQLVSLDVLDNIDLQTGALEPFKQVIAAFAEGAGINASGLANVAAGQAFTAEAFKIVLSSLAKQKGRQTDRDSKVIEATIARIKNTPLANQFINNTMRASNRREIEKSEFFDAWIDRPGVSARDRFKGMNRAWNKHIQNTPMISKRLKTPQGLPVFFFQFKEAVQNANKNATPPVTDEAIITEWKRREKAPAQRGR